MHPPNDSGIAADVGPSSGFRQVGGAWIHADARLAGDVSIEPGAVIGADVEVGAGSHIAAGAVLYGPTRIGADNRIHSTAVLGGAPQDLSYAGEPTRLEIGDRNVFREGVSIHRGSTKEEGVTRIGSDNFFMAYTHIGHDCVVGDHVITANGVLIAGHCHVASHANFSGGSGIMQHVTVGRHAFMGALTGARKDIEPFLCHDVKFGTGPEAMPQCINEVGLKRAGFAPEVIKRLRTAYKVLFLKNGRDDPAAARVELERRGALCAETEELIAFIEAKRGSRFGRSLG